MSAEKKQTIKVRSTASKLVNNTNPSVSKHYEQFQRTDDFRLHKKILDELECSNSKEKYFVSSTNFSSQSIDTISIEEYSTASIEARENLSTWRHDALMSKNNATRQLTHFSWKYKNPYSVSISNCTRNDEKFNNASGNILKDDEPQEGRTKSNVLFDCREYLANYQESCGVPRTEYSFAALIVVMTQATARSLWALLYMFINIAPIIQVFSFILRFVLDKVINIRKSKDLQQIMIKFIILAVQLLSVYICLIFIFSFIVFPILQMAIGIATKFLN